MNEDAKLESIKHMEWTLGLFFLLGTFSHYDFDILQLGAIILGSQIPDFTDLVLSRTLGNQAWVRRISHSLVPFALSLLLLLTLFMFPTLQGAALFFSVSILLHLFVDLFSGTEPVYPLGPLPFFSLNIINERRRRVFGDFVHKHLGAYIEDEAGKANPDLAWFWVLQAAAVAFFCVSLSLYLLPR